MNLSLEEYVDIIDRVIGQTALNQNLSLKRFDRNDADYLVKRYQQH